MTCYLITSPSRRTTVSKISTLHYQILLGPPLKEQEPLSIHLMDAPSSLATHSTFTPYEVRCIPSEITVKDQGEEATPTIWMYHNFSYLNSSLKWKTPMTTHSATGLQAHHIKVPLTTQNLDLQAPQPWAHLPAAHPRLLLNQIPNTIR